MNTESFYLQHRGLIINIVSVSLFGLIQQSGMLRDIDVLGEQWPLAIVFLLVFFLEPWATYYSMGAMNQRREEKGIKPIWLHRSIRGLFMAGMFWGGRLSIMGVLLLLSMKAFFGDSFLDHQAFGIFLMLLIAIREGVIVYFMASQKPNPNFKESYDWLADIILLLVLSYSQIVVDELFKDVGLKDLDNWDDGLIVLFPLILFFFVFYLPIRCMYTVEDFTFAQTTWQKVERVGSFLLVFASFLFFR